MTRKSSVYFLVLTLAPLLLTLQSRERSEVVHQIGLTVSKPFLLAGNQVSLGIRRTGASLHRFWSLYRTQGALEDEIQKLSRELVQMKEFEKENERLRELLDFKKGIPGKSVAARVIGRDLAPWRKTILLDKGAADGIRKRMAVVNAEGLVGRITEVGPLSARAILLTDPESRVSVLFQESRDLGVAEGDGSSFLRVTHIDRQAAAKVGDVALSSGFGQVYPKGVGVGRVEMVGTEKEGLELFASVRPFVNFSKLEEVLCITSSPPDS